MKKVIDVSNHNGKIDWEKVKKAGIAGTIIRAGYGVSTQDAQFKNNIEGAIKQGIPVGVYWFNYCGTKVAAVKEAEFCLKTIASYKDKITMPVFADWEYDSMRYCKQHGMNPSRQLITDMNKAFCERIKKEGYQVGVYYNLDYKRNYLYTDQLKAYVQWLAYYSSSVQKGYDLQQYTGSGSVDGIPSKQVDLNYLINEKIIKSKDEEKQPVKESIDVYYSVKAGGKIYPMVKNNEDYAGVKGKAITDVAIKVSKGSVKYRVHVLNGNWLPYVTGYDWKEPKNGYAGNGKPIDAIGIVLDGKNEMRYRVSTINGDYLPWEYDENTDQKQTYAGIYGKEIDRIQMNVKMK